MADANNLHDKTRSAWGVFAPRNPDGSVKKKQGVTRKAPTETHPEGRVEAPRKTKQTYTDEQKDRRQELQRLARHKKNGTTPKPEGDAPEGMKWDYHLGKWVQTSAARRSAERAAKKQAAKKPAAKKAASRKRSRSPSPPPSPVPEYAQHAQGVLWGAQPAPTFRSLATARGREERTTRRPRVDLASHITRHSHAGNKKFGIPPV